MSKLKLLLTGLAFAYKQLLVFMHTAHCVADILTIHSVKLGRLNPKIFAKKKKFMMPTCFNHAVKVLIYS